MQPIFSSASSSNWAAGKASGPHGAQWAVDFMLRISTQFERAARRVDARADLARLNIRMLDDIGLTQADRDRLV